MTASRNRGQAALLRSIGYDERSVPQPESPLLGTTPARKAKVREWRWRTAIIFGVAVASGFALGTSTTSVLRSLPNAETPSVRPALPAPTGFTASGYVVPTRSATVSSDEIGRLTKIFVKAGDRVRRGQVVALLDDGRQQAAMARAEAALEVAEAQAAGAEAALTATDPRYVRTRELSTRGFVSKASLDEIVGQRRVLTANVTELRRQTDFQRRSVMEVRRSLGYRVIRAPFDGIVSQLNAQVGEIVSPSSAGSTFTRTGICTLIDRSLMFALVELDESLMSKIDGADAISVEVPALQRRLVGTMDTAAYEVDRSKGTGTFRIRIVDPPAELLPNMEVRVLFSPHGSTS